MARETLSEIVERETVTDEADEPETDEDGDETEDDQPDEQIEPESQPAPMTDQDVERAFKKAEKVQARYETQLAAALGPIFEDLLPSPLDDIPGYVFPFNPNTDIGDYKRAQVAAYFGDDAPDLKPNPDSVTCETCDGWGMVLSGAKNDQHRSIVCPRCQGNGWKHTPQAQAQPAYQPVPGEIVPQSLNANGAESPPDAFGRPFGDPKYGQIPEWTGNN